MTKIEISRKGNAVGFTVKGETVTGAYLPKSRAWRVAVCNHLGMDMMIDARSRNFPTREQAVSYAASLVDAAKTAELAWW